uniref:Retrotransposon gag protein n=1 Tax=Solanum tuberosum TaxID=4113 RepID=M1DA05_SOLTU
MSCQAHSTCLKGLLESYKAKSGKIDETPNLIGEVKIARRNLQKDFQQTGLQKVIMRDGGPMKHLPVDVMTFKDHILNFNHLGGEPFHESWLRFKTLLIQCPTHEIPDLVLLDCFYRGLSPGNRELIDRLIPSSRNKYSYETAAKFLDLVAKTNKDTEKDQHLIILLGQMNNLTQKVEEVEVMSKQKRKYRLPTDQDRSMDIENKHIKYMLLTILQKLNEQDRVLEKIRKYVEALKQMSSSHSRSIQLIETLLGHIMPDLHQAQDKGWPNDVLANSKSESQVLTCVVPRR